MAKMGDLANLNKSIKSIKSTQRLSNKKPGLAGFFAVGGNQQAKRMVWSHDAR